MKTQYLLSLIMLLIAMMLFAACSDSDNNEDTQSSPTPRPSPTVTSTSTPTPEPTPTETMTPTPTETKSTAANPVAIIETSLGTINIELFKDKVPITVDNFIKLANDGFYDGIVFHRIKDDFMIQAGMETTDGNMKTSPYGMIQLETHPEVTHVDGAISMARTSQPNSATSQFFICDGPQHFLDNNYAAFGVVVKGIEVVREIAAQPHDNSNPAGGGVPREQIVINSIKIQSE